MPKRRTREADGQAQIHKRQRVVHEAPTFEEVFNARQLRQLLSFDQDLKRARHGLQSLKLFLDSFSSESGNLSEKRSLLKEYLESSQPRIASEDAVFLSDVMEMWSFGSQVHNDGITSAVPAVLALLLQVISSSFDLVSHAKGIAHTLLQERQLKLISRNLGASKGSAFIISPTLRLLREVASLDGGALAKRLFRSRDSTFSSFARNLEVRNSGDGVEDPTKPSVRTNAIKLLLVCLKFLPAEAKKELLMQKEVVSHLTFLLKDDPPYLILDMLDTLKKHVLMDDKVPREVKFRTFNTKTLDRLSGLYYYKHDEEVEGRPSVREAVHAFLVYVCTTPGAGILYTGTGMYPKDLEDEASQEVKDSDGLALERAGWMDSYTEEVPVANFALDEFILKLRPWSNLKHSELLVAIFETAPELVASYFLANKSFSFEPKLSMTWIGYAAFIFNTVQLPLPKYFGNKSNYRRVPPPNTIVIDNILPLPLKQKDLSRSLSNKSNLISFFAVRILVLALEKMKQALQMHHEAGGSNKVAWEAASRKLVDQLSQRIPDMKDVINCYKATPEDNVLQREASSRLLLLYYEVVPQMALMANFDVSSSLLEALSRLDKQREDPQDQALSLIELENLLSIAGYSPGMRWFAKSEGLTASPFVALLRVFATTTQGSTLMRVKEVLEFVATQNQLVLTGTGLGLLFRVAQEMRRQNMDPVWSFLDNCANRCASSPLKYLDLMEEAAATALDVSPIRQPVSLILVAMAEQLPFAVKAADAASVDILVKALSSFLGYSKAAREDAKILDLLAKKMNDALTSAGVSSEVKPRFIATLAPVSGSKGTVGHEATGVATAGHKELDANGLQVTLDEPVSPEEDNSALIKWVSKSVDDIVDGSYIQGLMRLLWSEHASIRQEALTTLLKMAAKIKESSYEEKDQVWLLLSELAESSRPVVMRGPVPSPLVAFAIHALEVLKNPLHCLYAKVNTYLTKAPIWATDKLPLAHDIFHGEPSEDDRYYTEISWLLSYLLEALRTPADLTVFHQKKWFEKILALAGNPYLRVNLTNRILKILYRATSIAGGSTTLVTRFGVLSWLDAQEASCQGRDDEAAVLLRALKRRVWETCDQERVATWSKQAIPRSMAKGDA